MGEPFVETRYAITGLPGLYGKYRATEIARERAEAKGDFEIAETMTARITKMETAPERKRIRWRA